MNWFKPNVNPVNTRKEKLNYMEGQAKHTRFKDSPLSFLTNLLNDHQPGDLTNLLNDQVAYGIIPAK